MSNHYKPRRVTDESKPMRTVLFRSRNKDNKSVLGFTERCKSFLTRKTPEELNGAFEDFVEKGLSGETSRFYMSVNERDNDATRKALLHMLIDSEDADMATLGQMATSVASKRENAATKHWMFDVDSNDPNTLRGLLVHVEDQVALTGIPNAVEVKKTPNGWHVITEHGFDTRGLDMTDIGLDKDGLALVAWKTK